MRSRYSAYALGFESYIFDTWHASARPPLLEIDAPPRPQWLGLDVLRHQQRGPDAAVVEFVARYKLGGRAQRLHEVSSFVREYGRWYYLGAS